MLYTLRKSRTKGNIMIKNKIIFPSIITLSLIIGALTMVMPNNIKAQNSNLLSSLKSGLWQFREKARGNNIVDAICVGDVSKMIKIKNKNDSCTFKMLSQSGNSVTYDYNCAGKGKGRTTIRKETSGLVQISSQGITDGQLFDFKLEARHAGSCR